MWSEDRDKKKTISKLTIVLSKEQVCFCNNKLAEYDVQRRPGTRKYNFEIHDSFAQRENVFFEKKLAEYGVKRRPGQTKNNFEIHDSFVKGESVFFNKKLAESMMWSEDRDKKTQFRSSR